MKVPLRNVLIVPNDENVSKILLIFVLCESVVVVVVGTDLLA